MTRRDRVVTRLRDALAARDSGAVEAVLAQRVSARSDDARPVMGAADVAAALVAQSATSLAVQSVNGETAIVARAGTDVVAVYCLTVRRNLVVDVFISREPPRLVHFNRVTDA